MDLIATKSFRYAGKALQPGTSFQARNRDGRLLVAIKKAKLGKRPVQSSEPAAKTAVDHSVGAVNRSPVVSPPPSPPLPRSEPSRPSADRQAESELTRLRAAATALGLNVDLRWGISRLNAEIAAKRRSGA
jgi:hypothetical protein